MSVVPSPVRSRAAPCISTFSPTPSALGVTSASSAWSAPWRADRKKRSPSSGAPSSSTPTCRPKAWSGSVTSTRNPFDFDAITRTPNTVDSHRLIRYAAELGHQDDVVQALFEAYFCDGRDIGDRAVLAEIGAAVGLDQTQITDFLASGAQASEIMAEDSAARRMGIQGVPCFIIDGRHVLSGAQPPEVFLQMFDVVAAETAAASNAGH
jgi:predicted DsbA family dithiol-disulfide isomerase